MTVDLANLPLNVRAKITVLANGCWRWDGARTTKGYGEAFHSATTEYAHRYTYRLLVGPIGEGLQIDHLCRNVSCVNPAHLEPVTGAENRRRAGAAKTHCKRGHLRTAENIRIESNGARRCLDCKRIYKQAERWGISAKLL